MTRLWILSDLHLETDPGRKRNLAAPDCDLMVAAGDIHEGDIRASVEAVARLADGRPAVMVLGNHDLCGLPIERACAVAARIGLPLGVHVLERNRAEVCGLRFVGGTLWDDVRPGLRLPGGLRPDLSRILSGDEPSLFGVPPDAPYVEPVSVELPGRPPRQATFDDIRRRHEATLAAIEEAAAHVVVTHYPPSDAAMERAGGASTWIHGHVHAHRRESRGGLDVILNAAPASAFAERMVVDVVPSPSLAARFP